MSLSKDNLDQYKEMLKEFKDMRIMLMDYSKFKEKTLKTLNHLNNLVKKNFKLMLNNDCSNYHLEFDKKENNLEKNKSASKTSSSDKNISGSQVI